MGDEHDGHGGEDLSQVLPRSVHGDLLRTDNRRRTRSTPEGRLPFAVKKNAIDIPRRMGANSLRYKKIFFRPAGVDFVIRIDAEPDYGIGIPKRNAVEEKPRGRWTSILIYKFEYSIYTGIHPYSSFTYRTERRHRR
jgi:hypothetical protein